MKKLITIIVVILMSCSAEFDNVLDPKNYITITGQVTDSSMSGIVSVAVVFNRSDTTMTDEDGIFLNKVPKNWEGVIQPVSQYFTFDPESISVSLPASPTEGHDFIATVTDTSTESVSLKFWTKGLEYGVADLDYFCLSIVPNQSLTFWKYECENPSNHTVGINIPRSNASNSAVWGSFGRAVKSTDPQSGYVEYSNVPIKRSQYIMIRYSCNSNVSDTDSIEILINDNHAGSFIPENTSDWNSFQNSDWIRIENTSN